MPAFHISLTVRTWMREHNQVVKQEGKGVRILPFRLPTKSRGPQSDRAEVGARAGRAIVEPHGLLSAKQLAERVCSHFGCAYEPHLSLPEKIS